MPIDVPCKCRRTLTVLLLSHEHEVLYFCNYDYKYDNLIHVHDKVQSFGDSILGKSLEKA